MSYENEVDFFETRRHDKDRSTEDLADEMKYRSLNRWELVSVANYQEHPWQGILNENDSFTTAQYVIKATLFWKRRIDE